MRKETGMTQRELAEKLGVTDKAVSKWERDLSIPDVGAFPKLAEIFGVSVEELIQVRISAKESEKESKTVELIELVLKGVALAMGVAVVVLSAMKALEADRATTMLGIGLTCVAITLLKKRED